MNKMNKMNNPLACSLNIDARRVMHFLRLHFIFLDFHRFAKWRSHIHIYRDDRVGDYYERLSYYFSARWKVVPFDYIRWLRPSCLHAAILYKQTHTHIHAHPFWPKSTCLTSTARNHQPVISCWKLNRKLSTILIIGSPVPNWWWK